MNHKTRVAYVHELASALPRRGAQYTTAQTLLVIAETLCAIEDRLPQKVVTELDRDDD